MINRRGNPYGIFTTSPELASGEKFLEHYALAFDLSRTIKPTQPEELADSIKSGVIEALGPDAPLAEVLAVSSLTAEARNRALRRPLERNRKELRQEERKSWPPFSIKSIKKQRALLNDQIMIFKEQTECSKVQLTYMKEADNLENDIVSTEV